MQIYTARRILLSAAALLITHLDLGAADYEVTYVDGHLTCTDTSGNGDTLQLVESSGDAGSVRFFASGRTFSVNGGANTTGQTDSFLMADLNSVTMDAGAGNDTVSIQSNITGNTLSLPSLTIHGGTGNDTVQFLSSITFQPGASLNVDLQDDAVNPGEDQIRLNANVSLLLSGAGGVVFKASRNITFNNPSVLETENGSILAEANQQATATAGNFTGIAMTNVRVQATGTGSVTLRGRSGNGGGFNMGLDLRSGTQVLAGAGGITMLGRGQDGHTNGGNYGVSVGAGGGTSVAVVKAVGGDISINGIGGSSGGSANNPGVMVEGAGEVEATGAGKVTLHGTGGNTTGTGASNHGVCISGTGTRVTTADGKLTLTGISGGGTGSTNTNDGVLIDSALLCAATGTGEVQIIGTPGGAGAGRGVATNSTAPTISSAGGDITISGTAAPRGGEGIRLYRPVNASGGDISLTGVGAGTDSSRHGILVTQAISTSGTGTITMHGTASLVGHGFGVSLSNAAAAVTTGGGSISLSGVGGGGGPNPYSIGVGVNGATVSGPGAGATLMIHGTGGASPQNNPYGVEMNSGAQLLTSGGDIVITGTGGANGTSSSYGVQLWSSQINAGGTGSISLTGTGGAAEGDNQHGFFFIGGSMTTNDGPIHITGTAGGQNLTLAGRGISKANAGTITVGGDHDLTLVADSMDLAGNNTINAAGNEVVILQKTTGTAVTLGGTDVVTGSPLVLGLADTELDTLVADEVRVGNVDTGAMSVAASISPLSYPVLRLSKAVTFHNSGGFNGDITSESVFERMIVNGSITLGGSGGVTGSVLGGFVPSATTVIPVIQGNGGVTGTFNNQPEGAVVNLSGLTRQMRLTYATGGGNHIGLYSAPVVRLLGNGVTINKGDLTPSATDHTNFGITKTLGNRTTVRSFTVLNNGLAPLTGISAGVGAGTPAGIFSLTGSPVTALASGESSSFNVTFDPAADGVQAGTVTVTSDQVLDSPYTFAIQGTGEVYTAQEQFDDAMTEANLTGPDALATATPGGDGAANLLKYAFNLDLTSPDVRSLVPGNGIAGLPVITFPSAGVMRVEYLRRIDSGLIYSPQKSSLLESGSWTGLSAPPVPTPINTNWERVHHDEPFDPGTTTVMFGRVRVSIP